MKILDT